MRSEIPALLKSEEWVSSKTLAKKIGVTRQALHKQMESLRAKGYEIQAKPRLGYRLISRPDLLLPEEIRARLKTQWIGKKICYFDSIDSTQNKAKELADRGETEGTLVIAETQSAGRGRVGREWHSQKGGIWFSLILRPQIAPQNVSQLALVFSLAVAKAIEEVCRIQCGLKWPNDVLITPSSKLQGPRSRRKSNSLSFAKNSLKFVRWKKVCGILMEMSAETEMVNWVALGIGLNVNNSLPKTLKNQAISLKDVMQIPVHRVGLLQFLLVKIEQFYERFLSDGFLELRKEYLRKSIFLGKKIKISDSGRTISGIFTDIDGDGSLILRNKQQREIKFLSGDVWG